MRKVRKNDLPNVPSLSIGRMKMFQRSLIRVLVIYDLVIVSCHFVVCWVFPYSYPWQRKTVAVNNSCDVIIGENGAQMFLQSRGKNQFFDKRELSLGKNWTLKNLILEVFLTSCNRGCHLDLENGGMDQQLDKHWQLFFWPYIQEHFLAFLFSVYSLCYVTLRKLQKWWRTVVSLAGFPSWLILKPSSSSKSETCQSTCSSSRIWRKLRACKASLWIWRMLGRRASHDDFHLVFAV